MKGMLIKAFGLAQKLSRKAKILALVVVGMMLSVQASALEVVTDTAGVIAFVPGAIVDPITTAIIATICAVAGIFLIVIGCRWVFRLCRGGA